MPKNSKMIGKTTDKMIGKATELKYEKLQKILKDYRKVLVAFSGGIDSALMLKAAIDTLGSERVLAATAVSAATAQREKEIAQKVASELRADHLLFSSDEIKKEGYTQNHRDRCFYCKSTLYAKLEQLARQNDCDLIVNGTNADDTHDHRPGQKAAALAGVRSPLQEALLSKEEIRQLAKKMKLSIWNKPASPCLSSRIPYFQKITVQKLKQVEEAEKFLHGLGLQQLRVRHHEQIARIELLPQDMELLLKDDIRKQVVEYFHSLGFLYVSLDLNGFSSGSLNKILPSSSPDVFSGQ